MNVAQVNPNTRQKKNKLAMALPVNGKNRRQMNVAQVNPNKGNAHSETAPSGRGELGRMEVVQG